MGRERGKGRLRTWCSFGPPLLSGNFLAQAMSALRGWLALAASARAAYSAAEAEEAEDTKAKQEARNNKKTVEGSRG